MITSKSQAKRLLKSFVKLIKEERLHRRTLILSVVFLMITAALPLWRIVPLAAEQPFLPLHYNIYFGVDRFGPWWHVFIPAILGSVLLIVNLAFETIFHRHEKLLSHFFTFGSVVISFTLMVATTLIVLINI